VTRRFSVQFWRCFIFAANITTKVTQWQKQRKQITVNKYSIFDWTSGDDCRATMMCEVRATSTYVVVDVEGADEARVVEDANGCE